MYYASVNDTPSIYPLRTESQVAALPTPLFGGEADSFVQQLRLAAQAHRAGRLESSVSHHRLSLAADPDNPALHSNLGNALRAANRLEEAVKHHFQSITLNRDYAEGFFNLALCLRDLARLD